MSAMTLPESNPSTAQPRRSRIDPAGALGPFSVAALVVLSSSAVPPYPVYDSGTSSSIPSDASGPTALALAERPARARIEALKELSGLTWDQLAKAFGVTRRSLLHWQSGGSISAANDERLTELLAQLQRQGITTPEEGRAWLMSVDEDGNSPWLTWTEPMQRDDPRRSWMSRQPQQPQDT